MHREDLFFDPLQEGSGVPRAEDNTPESGRNRRLDAEELQAQRQRELARVQEELRRMAQGFGPAGDGGPRGRRRRPAVER